MILTKEAVDRVLPNCTSKPGYKILVVSDNEEMNKYILTKVRESDLKIARQKHKTRIEYPNGSLIEIVPVNDNARGYKANMILADHRITIEAMTEWLLPLEVMYEKTAEVNK